MEYKNLVKQLREDMFLTQTEFAKLIGVSYTTVCRWETGVSIPSMKHKKRIFDLNNRQKSQQEREISNAEDSNK